MESASGAEALRRYLHEAIDIEPAEERAIAHRQLDTYLDGLSAGAR